jgi:hypothetical protein
MTTNQLIDLLAADRKPVERGRISRALITALTVSVAATFGAMSLVLGRSLELSDSRSINVLLIKLLFALGIVAIAGASLPRFARPGGEAHGFRALMLLPFVTMVAIAVIAIASSDWSAWGGMIVGKESLTCLISIPLFAIAPLAAVLWALRTGAPTDLARARAQSPALLPVA